MWNLSRMHLAGGHRPYATSCEIRTKWPPGIRTRLYHMTIGKTYHTLLLIHYACGSEKVPLKTSTAWFGRRKNFDFTPAEYSAYESVQNDKTMFERK